MDVIESTTNTKFKTDPLVKQALQAQREGNWSDAAVCWERALAGRTGKAIAPMRLAYATALRNGGRWQEAWESCAELLRTTQEYVPRAVEMLSSLNVKVGNHVATGALAADLEAREPMPRNALLLRMLVSAYGRDVTRSRGAMATLLKRPTKLDELRFIFEMSARTHLEMERGLLLARLLRHAEAMREQPGVDQDELHALIARVLVTLGDPRRALQALARSKTQPRTGLAAMTGWMATRMLDKRCPDFSAPKIFVIGLSKTGTTSLHQALLILGRSSVHWTNPVTCRLLDAQDLVLFDACSDTGISYQFERLYYAFPNARFIHTQRPVESWQRSFVRHYQHMRFGESFADMQARTGKLRKGSYGLEMDMINHTLYFNMASPADAYQAHDDRVRRFFADKADRLLTMNIFEGDGWDKLCAFLGQAVPDRPFPHGNKTVK